MEHLDMTQLLDVAASAPELLLTKLTYVQRLVCWGLFVANSALVILSQEHRAFGRSRLVVALPLAIANLLVPFLFDRDRELVTNIVAAFTTAWLSSFKVLGWAFNRGPLALPLNALQFGVVYAFPITPEVERSRAAAPPPPAAGSSGEASREAEADDDPQAKRKVPAAALQPPRLARPGGRAAVRRSLLNFLAKCVALAGIVAVLMLAPGMHHLVRTFLCGMGLYCFLGLLMDGPATLASSAIGLAIAPHFDEPYKSSSLADVWNHRWNLTAGGTLRFLIHDPILQGRLVHDPKAAAADAAAAAAAKAAGVRGGGRRSPARRAAALWATFFVSGAMHELVFWYFARRFSGYWLAYFLVQAPLLMAEAAGRGVLRSRGVQVPTWLAVPLTVLTVVVVSDLLFLPDITRIGITDKVIAHIWQTVRILEAEGLKRVRVVEGWLALLGVAVPRTPAT